MRGAAEQFNIIIKLQKGYLTFLLPKLDFWVW